MKRRPPRLDTLLRGLRDRFALDNVRRSADRLVDRGLVKAGWLPEMMDGTGRVLHMSDTPTKIYGYLARLLRRVNPSVVVHTGDFADDIKLELYQGEAEHYRTTIMRLLNILQAPHRRVILVLGNHDRLDLLPSLPPQCMVCDSVMDITLYGAPFRISHYVESLAGSPAKYNLFGHAWEAKSYVDESDRYFLNGVEMMRLIDPRTDEIRFLDYPSGTDDARHVRRKRAR